MKLSLLLSTSIAFLAFVTPISFAQEAVERSPQTVEPPILTEEPTATPSVEIEATPAPKAKRKKPEVTQESASGETATAQSLGMTEEQFKAAGLDKLSPEELRNLAATMKGYKRKVETQATTKANEEATQQVLKAKEEAKQEAKKTAKTRLDIIESRVDGTLGHLNGHSIIRLEDGTVWKQAIPDDHYNPQVTDHPTARVEHTAWGWKIRIAGLPDMYVDPVRD